MVLDTQMHLLAKIKYMQRMMNDDYYVLLNYDE